MCVWVPTGTCDRSLKKTRSVPDKFKPEISSADNNPSSPIFLTFSDGEFEKENAKPERKRGLSRLESLAIRESLPPIPIKPSPSETFWEFLLVSRDLEIWSFRKNPCVVNRWTAGTNLFNKR